MEETFLTLEQFLILSVCKYFYPLHITESHFLSTQIESGAVSPIRRIIQFLNHI